jgi:hypothetical protein
LREAEMSERDPQDPEEIERLEHEAEEEEEEARREFFSLRLLGMIVLLGLAAWLAYATL